MAAARCNLPSALPPACALVLAAMTGRCITSSHCPLQPASCFILAAVIGREITMSALREWAAALGPEAHSAVAVSWVGKWKTATQVRLGTNLVLV